MPPAKTKRPRIARTDEWQTIKQRSLWPEQVTYEMIRTVVLFSETSAERAKETGEARRSLYRKVEQFEEQGMVSLFKPTLKQTQDTHRSLPTAMRQAIADLKVEFPDLHLREIATICYIRFGRRPSHHTIQAVLARALLPTPTHRRFPPWVEIDDPAERRLAVVHLHATLKRWIEEGARGLDDKSHAPKNPKRKMTLDSMNEVRKLQENPELGEWRVHAALKDIGILRLRCWDGKVDVRVTNVRRYVTFCIENFSLFSISPAPLTHSPHSYGLDVEQCEASAG